MLDDAAADAGLASLTRGRAIVCGLVLPILQRFSMPKTLLCVSVDTATARGRNLSITSLRHVPGTLHSRDSQAASFVRVANGQCRDVGVVRRDIFVIPEDASLLFTCLSSAISHQGERVTLKCTWIGTQRIEDETCTVMHLFVRSSFFFREINVVRTGKIVSKSAWRR